MHRSYKERSLSCSAQCEPTSSKGCHIGRFWRNKHKQGLGAGSSGECWGNFRCSLVHVTNSLEKWWRIIPAVSGINYTELYLKCEEYHIINWGPGWDKNVASPFHKLGYILLLSLLLSQSSLAFSLQDLLYQQILKFSGLPSHWGLFHQLLLIPRLMNLDWHMLPESLIFSFQTTYHGTPQLS